MIAVDEDALICDMAETYGIIDFWVLPVKTAAVLASGLRDNSRIKMKMNDLNVPIEMMLSAMIADRLALLVWQQTADGQKNRNRPKQILNSILGNQVTAATSDDVVVFDSGKEFDEARKRLLRKGGE